MSTKSIRKYWILITFSLMLALVAGIFFPVITDESYYIDWAMRSGWPRLGFFDHPPMVSWIAGFANWYHHILSARIMVWIFHLASIWFVWKTAKMVIPHRAAAATLLVASTVGAIANGFLLTPDVGITTMWIIAIHESIIAIRENPRRWLTAGLATGIGLWSKYTMVLIGPVFLWGMIRNNRKQLLSPWPYAGGIICALIIAPHLWWQSENQWVTLKFQFGHGFSRSQTIAMGSILPIARDPVPGDSDSVKLQHELFAAMAKIAGFSESVSQPKPEKSRLEKAIQYTGDFLGGVAGLWGFYALALLAFLFSRPKPQNHDQSATGSSKENFGIIEAGAFFPLIFFGLLSPFSKIEANWPAMHMAPLAIWICSRWAIPLRVSISAIALHAFLIICLILLLYHADSFPGARNNRLLLESKGFQSLGEWAAKEFSGQALAVDSYQLKSAIRYHAPQIAVAQWPGITRGSEYTRGDQDDRDIEKKLLSHSNITIISLTANPKVIEGFIPTSFSGVRVCPDGVIGFFNIKNIELPCERGLREWWITTYTNQNPR